MSIRRRILLILFIIITVVGVDRLTKGLVRSNLLLGEAIPSNDSFIQIVYTLNDGVAFSMFAGHKTGIFILQTVLVISIVIMLVYFCVKVQSILAIVALSMMLGGGIGNLIDRIHIGAVVDFISVGSFPVFNVADSCLTVGCGLMLFYVIINERKNYRAAKNKEH